MNATRNEDQLGELEFLLLVDAIEEALVAIQQCGDSERALI